MLLSKAGISSFLLLVFALISAIAAAILDNPSLARDISATSKEILDLIHSKQIPTFDINEFPCHTQAVKRTMKLITEAASKVNGGDSGYGFIRATLQSFCQMPIFENEVQFMGGTRSAATSPEKEVCMKELGCFSITPDFKHVLYRPINKLPQTRETINTRHLLYTRRNPKEADLLIANSRESVMESHLNPEHPIKFIVHGFMDSEVFGPWMVRMKDEFLLHGEYNIIVVDWSGGNKIPYFQASSNTRVVGAEIALMIKALNKYVGIKPEDCHIIGHSLGSHIAGYAGERLQKLGRITACDPAEPYFQNMPPTVRLDPTDADYIDVIHSDATSILLLGFGMSQLVGHADFFPNNGRKQPGCKNSDNAKTFIIEGYNEGARRLMSCNHQRSIDFMHHSINFRKVVPVGYECSDWKAFLQGKCAECGSDTKKCAIMGIRADEYKTFRNNSIQRSFYLQTDEKAPFWFYHYQVAVKLAKPRVAHKDLKGSFEILLHGSKEDLLTQLTKESKDLFHGARYTFLVTTNKELGTIKSITFKWFSASKNPIDLIRKPKLYIEYVTVIPMNVIEKSPRDMTDRVFCGTQSMAILPKFVIAMQRNNDCKKYL